MNKNQIDNCLKIEIIDTIDTKTKFIVLHALTDITSKQISEALGIPYSTARDWTTKTDENIDIRIIAEGRGRKPEITEETKRKIARDVRMNPQKFSTRKLASSTK